MPRFAANLSMMFNEWSFLDRFATAADAGFDAVEYLFPYDFPPERIADALSRNALTQALFNFPPGDWARGERGLAALPDRKEDFRRSIARALEYAEATEVKRLHVMAGLADPDDSRARNCFMHNIQLAAEAAAPHGIDILLEPINGRDMPGYFMNDFERAATIIGELNQPNVKLQFDIYHRQILHGDVIMGLKALIDMTAHVQIASVPLRNEPMTGELDDQRVFQTLNELGYLGFVGCEYRPRAGTVDGLGWMKTCKE